MSRFRNLALAFSFLLLSGCVVIPGGYTPAPRTDIRKGQASYDLTFSFALSLDDTVEMSEEFWGRSDNGEWIAFLRKGLLESGAFRSVSYRPLKEKSAYHVHFLAHYAVPPDRGTGDGWKVLSAATLTLFPVVSSNYLDLSALLFLDGKVVHAPATAEELRNLIWLPCLPVALVWNQSWAWSSQEEKCARYLISELVHFQQTSLPLPKR